MSRSGYVDDDCDDPLELGRWRAAVRSAIRGKRGQALLREMLAAMDATPEAERRLIAEEIVAEDGERCALGCVAVARKMDVSQLDPEDYDAVAAAFGVNAKLVQEIAWENDEGWYSDETPEDRWARMRKWVERHTRPANATARGAATP